MSESPVPPMNLTWRDAAETDIGLLAEWNHQLIRDEGHRNPMNVEQLAVRMRRWLADEGYRAIVFSDGEPLAYALFRAKDDETYLRQLFVRRDRRSQGIGRAAIGILRGQIWDARTRLTVEVLCRNPRAIAFYRNLGYTDYCLALEIMPPPIG